MPYKLHHWDYDSDTDTDPGWPRRYLTYDHRTACAECHAPNGALRILQNLFGGPATRCVHHRGRDDDRVTFADNRGWGGAVRGFVRIRNCKNPAHYALAFQRGIDTSQLPDRIGPRNRYRTRLPDTCHERTPRGQRPSHTLRYYDCPCPYAAHHGDGEEPSASASPAALPEAQWANGVAWAPGLYTADAEPNPVYTANPSGVGVSASAGVGEQEEPAPHTYSYPLRTHCRGYQRQAKRREKTRHVEINGDGGGNTNAGAHSQERVRPLDYLVVGSSSGSSSSHASQTPRDKRKGPRPKPSPKPSNSASGDGGSGTRKRSRGRSSTARTPPP